MTPCPVWRQTPPIDLVSIGGVSTWRAETPDPSSSRAGFSSLRAFSLQHRVLSWLARPKIDTVSIFDGGSHHGMPCYQPPCPSFSGDPCRRASGVRLAHAYALAQIDTVSIFSSSECWHSNAAGSRDGSVQMVLPAFPEEIDTVSIFAFSCFTVLRIGEVGECSGASWTRIGRQEIDTVSIFGGRVGRSMMGGGGWVGCIFGGDALRFCLLPGRALCAQPLREKIDTVSISSGRRTVGRGGRKFLGRLGLAPASRSGISTRAAGLDGRLGLAAFSEIDTVSIFAGRAGDGLDDDISSRGRCAIAWARRSGQCRKLTRCQFPTRRPSRPGLKPRPKTLGCSGGLRFWGLQKASFNELKKGEGGLTQ